MHVALQKVKPAMEKPVPTQSTSTGSSEKPASSAGIPQKFTLFLAILVVLILALVSWYFYTNLNKPVSPIKQPELAATVNGEKILKSDYDAFLKSQQDYYNEVYPKLAKQKVSDQFLKDLPKQTLKLLIEDSLLAQFLKTKGVVVAEQEVRDYVKKEIVDKNYGGDWEVYKKDIVSNKTSLDNVLRSAKRELMRSKVVEIQKLSPTAFEGWYSDLKKSADIKIYIVEAAGEVSR